LFGLAVPAVALYGLAAWRYWQLHRTRPAPVLLGVTVAWILLGEASIAVAFSRNWHASWWEWHLLMAAAFGIVALTALRERHRGEVFASLYLDDTLGRIDRRYSAAVKAAAGEELDDAELRRRFGLSADEAAVVRRAAGEVEAVQGLLQPYLSPQLAARLREEPKTAALGGEEREVSVLFADLQGFTAFSERHSPAEVLEMLNSYWAQTVPVVLGEHGGMIEHFEGDGIMVVFNAAADQPDHALRAARAGLALQRAAGEVHEGRDDWPRFRVSINTGPAIVGNVGTEEQRSFTAIGDTTNLAARLQTAAEPGEVVLGGATYDAVRASAEAQPIGELELKGKSAPVAAYRLVELR
jgi:adenylate cyclase